MRRKPQPRARTLLKISTEPYTLDSPVIGAPLTLQREKRVETEGVLPGDKLHDGNHLGLSNEQHWALIEICEVEDALSHSALLKVISDISEYYTQFALLESLNPPLYEHKQRLQRTAKLVKKLRPLIETSVPF